MTGIMLETGTQSYNSKQQVTQKDNFSEPSKNEQKLSWQRREERWEKLEGGERTSYKKETIGANVACRSVWQSNVEVSEGKIADF